MTTASSFAQQVANEQRQRLVGSVMRHVEQEMDLPTDVRIRFRKKLLQSVGVYHDFVLDSLKAAVADEGSVLNEELIAHLGRLADEVRALRELQEG